MITIIRLILKDILKTRLYSGNNLSKVLTAIFVFMFSLCSAQSVETRADVESNLKVPTGGIVIGDSLPEAFWRQELKIVNHPYNNPTLKLADYRQHLLVLDFLNTACVACIKSVDKWNLLQPEYRHEVKVIPIHLYGDNDKILPLAQQREWKMPIATGNSADTTINQLFYAFRSFGQVWIKDGKLVAIPHNKDVSPELIGRALSRRPLGIEMNDFLTYFDKRYGMADRNKK
ncbi:MULTISPECIES: hypothetical protein [Sphingobacterium]|uniref:TlpA family protein disulfide reductase n=1 Tax=Sphingobacterium TaxID=28453 RepID=UPI0013E42864|nr:hypothetical protein [Sphingobacterium sp. DR205]QIH31494.1 hypothetical protein G6053_00585 [Sphingobacterium sp. DR205]